MKSKKILLTLIACLFAVGASAQTTAFTYQGRLTDGSSPANGSYDLQFSVFDAPANGIQHGVTITNPAVAVSNGLFTVSLNFGAGIFTGPDRWLLIGVRTNGNGAFTTLSPRQPLTPSPYAIFSAGSATAGGVAPGSVTSAGIAPASITAANISPGQVVKSLNGFTDAVTISAGPNVSLSASANNLLISTLAPWTLTGNAGTSPTNGNFIGTTDFQPLDLKAGGMRVLRLQPDPRLGSMAGNLIGGFTNNTIEGPASGGDFIGGGGFPAGSNVIHSNTSGVFIGAGSANQIGPNINDSVIGGGFGNTIQGADSVVAGGESNTNSSELAVISGGLLNQIKGSSDTSAIGGGSQNTISANNGTIGGGGANQVTASYGTVGGGGGNLASGQMATVPGGNGNMASGANSFAAGIFAIAAHANSFVWSDGSSVIDFSSTTANQFSVQATGGVRFVTAGAGLTVDGEPISVPQATVSDSNHLGIVNVVNGSPINSIAGGVYGGTIAGGGAANYQGFSTLPNQVLADFGTVGGGEHNTASGVGATVAGGVANTASGIGSTVGGGSFQNSIGGYSVTGGGFQNNSSGNYATVPGGFFNSAAGQFSFAAGQNAQALNDGAFVWADSQPGAFSSTASNQFLIRASGGVGINTNNPGTAALNVAGAVQATKFQGDGSGLFNVSSGALGNYVSAIGGIQTTATANVFQDVPFTTDEQISGWTHASGTSQYTNAQTGLYLIQYNAQATITALPAASVSLRAALNSVEIPGSQAAVALATNVQIISLSRSFIASANAADVLTLQFTSSSTSGRLTGTGSGTTRPGVTMTIVRIQ